MTAPVSLRASGESGGRAHEAWPDIAKGIGILLVVYGHVARGIEKAGLPIDPVFFKTVDALIYAFHMPLFFFVSGYLFWGSVQARGYRDVLPGRLALLIWLYVIWSVGHGAVEVMLGRLTNGSLQWADVFALWVPRAHFWYLYALALLVLVTSAFAWVPKRYQALALFAFAAVSFTTPGLGTGWYPLLMVGWHLIYFTAGFMLAANRVNGIRFRSHSMALYVFWVTLAIAWVSLAAPDGLLKLVAAVAGIILTAVASLFLTRRPLLVSRALAFLGSIALPIYLAHILAGSGMRIVLHKGLGVDLVWLHLVLGLVAGVLLPWAFWIVTKRLGQGWLWSLPGRGGLTWSLVHRSKA
jgi:fucose 4-O-acetylase-like acetyltransferase